MKSLRNPGVLLSTVMLGLAIGATPLAQADTAPATEATHNQTTKASTSKLPVEESDKTYVEYRSEADREAFEKLGQYIEYDEKGLATAVIPADVRSANKDGATRIDEFIQQNNSAVDPAGHPTFTTYGNETKVSHWGPVVKVYLSHNVVSKATKIFTAGGAAGAVTKEIIAEGLAASVAGWVAVGLGALVAAGALCDWNDQGIILWQNPVPGMNPPYVCTPQK
ncbi:hypothetical protein QP414_07530 [Corynebacterium simulans]|uniref:hypothetical protein n=1 Tax=Corynebacterium simulans TaxID=146827 RepID=UPI00254C6DC6|nr:hypothetical protein [Corynebacterium simulans]MDK7139157.1 hypothetical protein [Corynebacterium simulans]